MCHGWVVGSFSPPHTVMVLWLYGTLKLIIDLKGCVMYMVSIHNALSNLETIETGLSVLNREVSLIQRLLVHKCGI